jgi:hypothetical protein
MLDIMLSNPFNVLHVYDLDNMAQSFGVSIEENLELDSNSSVCSISDNILEFALAETTKQYNTTRGLDHPREQDLTSYVETPPRYNMVEELDDRGEGAWTEVHWKKRGKHPRKLFR